MATDDIPAKFHLKNTGLFIQDTWAINYNLSLMFGVRLDIPDFTSQNKYNTDIQSRYGYDNTKLVDKSLFQPRVGFNYTFDSDRPTQLRGGVGLFGGAAPNVWLAGAYQNTGLNYVEYNVSGNPGGFSADADNPFIPDPSKIIARQNVDIIAPGTRLPSVWKANLAFDHELPWYGIVASAEVLFTKVKDGLYFERLDLTDGKGKGATFVSAQDGRELYWNPAGLNQANSKIDSRSGDNLGMENGTNGALNRANRPNNIGDVMLLRNTDKGRGSQATFSLAKPLTENWGWSLGYTYTQSKEVSPLTSSQNTSNWNNTQILNANENIAYNSRYAIKDRITGTLGGSTTSSVTTLPVSASSTKVARAVRTATCSTTMPTATAPSATICSTCRRVWATCCSLAAQRWRRSSSIGWRRTRNSRPTVAAWSRPTRTAPSGSTASTFVSARNSQAS